MLDEAAIYILFYYILYFSTFTNCTYDFQGIRSENSEEILVKSVCSTSLLVSSSSVLINV